MPHHESQPLSTNPTLDQALAARRREIEAEERTQGPRIPEFTIQERARWRFGHEVLTRARGLALAFVDDVGAHRRVQFGEIQQHIQSSGLPIDQRHSSMIIDELRANGLTQFDAGAGFRSNNPSEDFVDSHVDPFKP